MRGDDGVVMKRPPVPPRAIAEKSVAPSTVIHAGSRASATMSISQIENIFSWISAFADVAQTDGHDISASI